MILQMVYTILAAVLLMIGGGNVGKHLNDSEVPWIGLFSMFVGLCILAMQFSAVLK